MTFWQKILGAYHIHFWGNYYRLRFGKFGKKSIVLRPCTIDSPQRIFVGNKVYISTYAWLAANPQSEQAVCKLIIGDGTSIGRNSHIYATSLIEIGKKVLMAEGVYISDNAHDYSNINIPIMDQPVLQLATVQIGDGAWIGENVCIMGASVGKNCIIGANAVVTKNIPDYCVAVGAPAKVIKRYNFETSKWQNTNSKAEFIYDV